MSSPTRALSLTISGADGTAVWPTGLMTLPCSVSVTSLYLGVPVMGEGPLIRTAGGAILLSDGVSDYFSASNDGFEADGFQFNASTETVISGIFQADDGNTTTPAYAFTNAMDTGMFLGDFALGFSVGDSTICLLSGTLSQFNYPTLFSGIRQNVQTVNSTHTALLTDHTILGNAALGALDVDLPAASTVSGQIYVIKKIDSSGNAVNIDPNGSDTIDGSSSSLAISTQWNGYAIQSNGSGWLIIAQF